MTKKVKAIDGQGVAAMVLLLAASLILMILASLSPLICDRLCARATNETG